MVNNLALKRRRDIGRQKWQFIAVIVTVVLGVTMFGGSFNAYLNLGSSLESSYDRLNMADMTVTGAVDGFSDEVESVAGVESAIDRQRADLPFEIGEYTFIGRAISIPADTQPELNQIDVEDGEYLSPGDPSGVLLESHAAKDFEVEVGDSFTMAGQEVTVVGIVVSPEYLWPARDRQSVFTPPKSFGVVFVDESMFDGTTGAAIEKQTLVLYEDDVDVEVVDAAVRSAAEAASADDVEALADQPSNATIRLEIEGQRTIAIAMPLLFLAAAGMAIYVVITRLIYSQRGVIGTLRASGFTSRAMSRHYRMFGISVGLVGAVVGSLLGLLMARGMTSVYISIFEIPDLVAEIRLTTILAGLLFGAFAGALAATPPARAVAHMAPAEAMRGDVPAVGGKRSIFETLIPPLRKAPVRWKMSLRGIGRNKQRSATMVMGVVLSMTLILGAWGVMDTMFSSMDTQFNEVAIEDAMVAFSGPVDDSALTKVSSVDGVDAAEPVIGSRVTVRAGDETYGTLLEGYQADTRVHGFEDGLPAEGVLLGRAMEEILDVEVGDDVTLQVAAVGADIVVPVAGFVNEPMGTSAYMQADALTSALSNTDSSVTPELLSSPSITTVKIVFDGTADSDTMVDRLRDVEGVAVVVDSSELRNLVEDFQVFFYVFIGMMVLFGAAMAFALIFNIISVNVAERSGEFASMRANGLTHRRVASLITGETALLTAIGVVPGLIVGYLAAAALTNSFSTDQFPIVLDMRPMSYVGAVAAMFVVAGLSLIPAVRAIKRINVGEVVRERAT